VGLCPLACWDCGSNPAGGICVPVCIVNTKEEARPIKTKKQPWKKYKERKREGLEKKEKIRSQ
jgi:hypothetical protein